MDSLNVTKAPPDASDTDNEGESVYIDDMTFIADDYNNMIRILIPLLLPLL